MFHDILQIPPPKHPLISVIDLSKLNDIEQTEEWTGLKVQLKTISERTIPEELQHSFDESPALKAAFEALTPGRQRGYLLHFSAPKQSKTRASRIEQCMPQILEGKGLQD